MANDLFSFHCVPCEKSVRCDHQGLRDVIVHCERESHKRNVKANNKTQSIAQFLTKPSDSALSKNIIKAEVMVTNFLVQHNLPISKILKMLGSRD